MSLGELNKRHLIWATAITIMLLIFCASVICIANLSRVQPFVLDVGQVKIQDSEKNTTINMCDLKIFYNNKKESWNASKPCPKDWRISE